MKLDFNPANGKYLLWLPRGEGDPETYRLEHGLDFYDRGSAVNVACLATDNPYAAASFWKVATPAARAQLGYLVDQIEASWAPSSDRHIEVPDDKELWPFQRASVDYAMSREHALVGDEPGLGKTAIGIAVANEMRAKRILVVCPASIRHQWCDRIEEWTTAGLRYRVPNSTVYPIVSSRYGVHEQAYGTVVSWDLIRREPIWRALAKTEYDLLILDEAHYAKQGDAKRTRAIFGGGRSQVAEPLAKRCKKIVALTGTPLPNRPGEAYVLGRGLCWEAFDFLSEDAFHERFNPRRIGETRDGKRYKDEREGRLPELQNRMRGHFMVRHLKREVMTQLHLPVYDLIRVEETEAVKAALQAESLLQIDPEVLDGADAEILGQIATARRLMGVAMAPQVVNWINMLVDGGESKLVLFAWHTEVLDLLCKGLHRHGIVRVDGKDSARSKHEKVQRFITDPEVGVIVGNVLSLGTGTDGLQKVATHGLIAEPDWVFGNNVQCFDRLDRGGQVGQVQGDIFVAPGSIAEKILASALRKGDVVFQALDKRVA